jgi:ribonuclease HI
LYSQAAVKAPDSYRINSEVIWDCHQSLEKITECNKVQLIWVLGQRVIEGNEAADQLARLGYEHHFKEPEPT